MQPLDVSSGNIVQSTCVYCPVALSSPAKQLVFAFATSVGQPSGGVLGTQVVSVPATERMVYQPGNPLADGKVYVRMPNVHVVGEMVNTISASRSYQANVEVLNTTKSMMMKTLTLGQ